MINNSNNNYQTRSNDKIVKDQIGRKYDLEDRTLKFSKQIIDLVKGLPKNTINFELSSQVIRSAGSVGANYREANEAFSKKDFCMRIKICRKEAKETAYWLELLKHNNSLEQISLVDRLIDEASQLVKIFSAIVTSST